MMTDQRNDFRNDSHLPECPAYVRDWGLRPPKCYCYALRACEERIYSRDIFMDAWKKGYAEAKKKYSEYLNADNEGSYSAGYQDALDDAIACFEEDDAYGEIQKLRGIE